MWLWFWRKHPDEFLSQHWQSLCFPVPVRVCRGVQIYRSLKWRAGVLGRLLSLRWARVQQWRRFVRVEGSAVVLRSSWTCWPVLWHSPEVLKRSFSSLVVIRTEFIRTSSFGVRMPEMSFKASFYYTKGMTSSFSFYLKIKYQNMSQGLSNSPVVIGPVTPVVPVVAVLLIRPFSRGGVVAITSRAAICVAMWTSFTIVILIAMGVIWMMSVSLPWLVAVAGVTVFSVPLPVSSICNEICQNSCLIFLKADSTLYSMLISVPAKQQFTIPHIPSFPKCRLLEALYGSLWCPRGPCWAEWDADLEDGCVPVESLLEPDGSGLKDFTFPTGSSFFFWSFWKCYRIISVLVNPNRPCSLENQSVNLATCLFFMWSLLLCHFVKLVKLTSIKLCKLRHENPEVSARKRNKIFMRV